ncbi:MAG: hypothetical protein ABEI06_07130 [Halobacteriaceae archaeon]
MSLKCSLLGHDFGEVRTERDREERGDEVVITEREIRTCNNCGEEQVIADNTEVRSVEPAPESVQNQSESEETQSSGYSTENAPSHGNQEDSQSESPSPEEDDGIILDDEEGQTERQPGQWPSAEDTRLEDIEKDSTQNETQTRASEHEESTEEQRQPDSTSATSQSQEKTWPNEAESPDEGYSADPPSEEDIELGSGPSAESQQTNDTGEEMIEPEPQDQHTDTTTPHSTVFTSSDDVNVDAKFVCPSCGFQEEAMGSSHRNGDICPECKEGYLTEKQP